MHDARDLDRLLILGLDGATWTVLDPFRQRGFLPNLDALLKRSAHGTLRSTIPPVTSAAWTTMMTGCRPGRHGVFDHRYFDGGTGRMRVNNASRVRVPTFWHTLSGLGRPVISLNLPVTYPPLRVKGIVVSGIDAPRRNENAEETCNSGNIQSYVPSSSQLRVSRLRLTRTS
mgnify:CR=1 FL=1